MNLYGITVKQLFHSLFYQKDQFAELQTSTKERNFNTDFVNECSVSQDVFFSQPVKEAPINAL